MSADPLVKPLRGLTYSRRLFWPAGDGEQVSLARWVKVNLGRNPGLMRFSDFATAVNNPVDKKTS